MTPKVGDCATYVLCAKTMPMIQYNLKFLMEIPYYRRKMEAHRRIRCCVYINKQLVYYQFATDPWFKDVISITFCASGEKTEVKFVMECVQSEESWVRGAAFKVWIRNLHLELSHDKKTEWVWKNLQLDRFSCLSEGISFTESEKDELIVKQSAHSGVCYFETFDGGVNTPPGEKYFGDSKITPGEWVHINFKGRVKKVESKILTLFLIQYNANSHERLGSISHEIKLSEVFGFYSIRMQVMPKATDYKLCFRTEGEKIDIYINLSEFEVLQIQDIDFKEKL